MNFYEIKKKFVKFANFYEFKHRSHEFSAYDNNLTSSLLSVLWRCWLIWQQEGRVKTLVSMLALVLTCTLWISGSLRYGLTFLNPSVLWHCWLGDRKGIRPTKSWVLVCWWWHFDWSFARLIAPVVTTNSIILSSNNIQNGDILVRTKVHRKNKRESERVPALPRLSQKMTMERRVVVTLLAAV